MATSELQIRRFHPGEERELWELFFNTVRNVNLRDYSLEQVRAWAPDSVDEEHWRIRIERNNPFVCIQDNLILGFADIQRTGLIDQFFVHYKWQGKGVGHRLFFALESTARMYSLSQMFSNVSITARPFFESRGFVVEAVQHVGVADLALTNFRMRRDLAD